MNTPEDKARLVRAIEVLNAALAGELVTLQLLEEGTTEVKNAGYLLQILGSPTHYNRVTTQPRPTPVVMSMCERCRHVYPADWKDGRCTRVNEHHNAATNHCGGVLVLMQQVMP